MTLRFFILSFAALFMLTSRFAAAAPTVSPGPPQMLNFLIGTWDCSSVSNGKTQRYTATYSAFGRGWLRTINTSGASSSMDMMSYKNGRWTVVDMEPDGSMSVLSAPNAGSSHIAYATVYPRPGLDLRFDRKSATAYSLTFSLHANGKTSGWTDNCSKRS